MRITSYINNLHPSHEGLYAAIEELISLAIKPWNACLVRGQRGWKDDLNNGQLGPVPVRIITYGVEWENELPEWALAFRVPSEIRIRLYHKAQEEVNSLRHKNDQTKKGRKRYRVAQNSLAEFTDVAGKEDMELPPPDSDLWQRAREYLELPADGSKISVEVPEDWVISPWDSLRHKAERVVRWKHSEPGTAFSYEERKTGRHNDRAVVDVVRHRNNWRQSPPYKPVLPPHTPNTVALQDTMQGLQVIVQMGNIDLTPQTPSYPGGPWDLEGQLNEHIAAVAVFAYSVANITEPRIAFRQHTSLTGCFYQFCEELYTTGYHWRSPAARRVGKSFGKEGSALAAVLGYAPEELMSDNFGARSWQDMGSVETRQGRLVAFPGVVEHRLEPFRLVDSTKPGHYRAAKLFLVDPHYRVCSTRNVPPQQHHWWAREVGGDLASIGLPREIVDAILEGIDSWPMGTAEARQRREEIIKEHNWNKLIRLGVMPGPSFS